MGQWGSKKPRILLLCGTRCPATHNLSGLEMVLGIPVPGCRLALPGLLRCRRTTHTRA